MHYKTIKFNIKIPLNIHNFHFCGALCAQFYIATADFFFFFFGGGIFLTFAPPPPQSENGSTPLYIGGYLIRKQGK